MNLFDYPDPLLPTENPLPDWTEVELADLLIKWIRQQQEQ
jgi:hypothetical protein